MAKNNTREPTHTVRLLPHPNAQDKQSWPFVGAAWENRDGSFNIVLNNELPCGARIQVKKRKAVRNEAPTA